MRDLNDAYYFSEVVTHGGFAAAGRALKQPKSKLSRRVAQLETQLGIRLIERSSRRFQVTEVGRKFYDHCRSAMAEMERAEAVVAASRTEPRGTVRFSCPTGLVELIAGMLPDFLTRYPQVNLRIIATNRRVDLIEERIDVALRVRITLDSDAALTMRTLGKSTRILLASPGLANRLADTSIADLATMPTLSSSEEAGPVTWQLVNGAGEALAIEHEPRLACGDFIAVREAAIAGMGVALLPDHICAAAMQAGQLVHMLPGWHGQEGIVHLVFTTSRGLPPPVRAWIDHLAERFRDPSVAVLDR